MSRLTRRSFLKQTLVAAGTITLAGTKSSGRVIGANDTIRVAIAGINGRGGAHVSSLVPMKNVEVTYLIDPDTRTYDKRLKQVVGLGGKKPQTIKDVRVALEDKNLDALTIATPNGWHALMTIWACQAGKDVYVEKPCSHDIHEGRIAVETARKYNRIVQHGTQSRSSLQWANVAEVVKSGKLGKLLVSRGIVYKDGGGPESRDTRGSLGNAPPSAPPAELDFNLWLGPAKEQPYHANLVHYRWHWFWDFGNGDIGNQGVHQIDIARWMIPGATLPKTVIGLGGRMGHQQPDQGETAGNQIALMDFGETQLIFEVRSLKSKPYQFGGVTLNASDNILHLDSGIIHRGRFYPKGKTTSEPLPKLDLEAKRGPGGGGRGEGGHFGNFIAAMRSRKVSDLNAPLEEGHYSAALCHLANASYRAGEDVSFNPRTKAFGDNKDAYDALERMEDYLKEHAVKLEETKYRLGHKLTVDPKTERAIGDTKANEFLTRVCRPPFVVPDKVV
jgi:predicted dehydrogenase